MGEPNKNKKKSGVESHAMVDLLGLKGWDLIAALPFDIFADPLLQGELLVSIQL